MYRLEFTLKQHTPLIQFQHDQAGATLRATEVKPKLDFFIMKKLINDTTVPDHLIPEKFKQISSSKMPNGKYHPWKNWLVGKGLDTHVALDYKIIFRTNSASFTENFQYSQTPDYKWRPEFPCIFGNVDSEDKWKHITYSKSIKATIIALNNDLRGEIETGFPYFLLINNFGFRQSKGFGSFYIDETDKSYVPPALKYHFTVSIPSEPTKLEHYKKLFSIIDLLYKTLRSGINTSKFGGIYFKSLMFMYAKSLDQQWDKKTLRETFYLDHELYMEIKRSRNSDPKGSVQFNAIKKENLLFRDLLGLSSEQDWMGYGKPKKDKEGNLIVKNGKTSYKSDTLIKSTINGEIERFKSPIVFKPIKRLNQNIFDIYLAVDQIPQKYKGQQFDIRSKTYGTISKSMSIPLIFNLTSFLTFCFQTIFPSDSAFNAHLANPANSDALTLKKIYSELRNC